MCFAVAITRPPSVVSTRLIARVFVDNLLENVVENEPEPPVGNPDAEPDIRPFDCSLPADTYIRVIASQSIAYDVTCQVLDREQA